MPVTVFRCSQLATASGSRPLTGDSMADIAIIDDAGIAVRDGMIAGVGRYRSIGSRFGGRAKDLGEVLVTPGFVDCHSHSLFAGSREGELSMKLAGKSYMEILASGGGISSTVRSTRKAGKGRLVKETTGRLRRMLSGGITAFEIKSGYGLNLRDEVKMLRAIGELPLQSPIVPTYLGAHAFPPEMQRAAYVADIVERQLPEVWRLSLSPYCDIFIEEGAFTTGDSETILSRAKSLGFKITAHVDEFSDTGGARVASGLGAVSVSHLAFTPRSEFRQLAESSTTGIILPSTPLLSMSPKYPDARSMISSGMAVAIGTDLSPNSWNESILLSCMLAVYNCGMKQEEALAASTLNSACAIGLGEVAGTLEKGKRADFACLGLDDFRKLFYRYSPQQVESVYVGGRKVSP